MKPVLCSSGSFAAPGLERGRGVLLALGVLGFSCVVTQLVLMREMLGFFSGNEMVLGVVLGLWLCLMGFGAWLGLGLRAVLRRSVTPRRPPVARRGLP